MNEGQSVSVIFEAQKAGVPARLTGTGRQPETADRWLDAWEVIGEDRAVRDHWDRAFTWVSEQRAAGAVSRATSSGITDPEGRPFPVPHDRRRSGFDRWAARAIWATSRLAGFS